jgi:hypothetical protein
VLVDNAKLLTESAAIARAELNELPVPQPSRPGRLSED